jgi:hypothetical protein
MIVLAFGVASVRGEALSSTWNSSGSYSGPGIELQSCVTNSDYQQFYCIGGFDGTYYTNVVQYAPVSSPGTLGGWQTTKTYPLSLAGESCVAYSIYIYCLGGYNGAGRTNVVYYSVPSSNGLNFWSAAVQYPIAVELQSCFVSNGYLYCVGGYDGAKYYNSTYYSQLSPTGGLGTWTKATGYPTTIAGQSCVTSAGYVYCIGGFHNSTSISNVYYAPLSSSGGLTTWNSTTPYPFATYGESCAAQSGYIYCVGGYAGSGYSSSTYYAGVLPSGGLGPWVQTTSYPSPVVQENCNTFSNYLYCIGGFSGTSILSSIYSNAIIPPTATTIYSTVTTTTTVATTPTVTVTSTTTYGTANQTTTTTVTKTNSSGPIVYVTTTSTRTVVSFSVMLTTTVTSSTTIPSGATTTITTEVPVQVGQASSPLPLTAGAAVAGLVVGAIVVIAFGRLRARGQTGEGGE